MYGRCVDDRVVGFHPSRQCSPVHRLGFKLGEDGAPPHLVEDVFNPRQGVSVQPGLPGFNGHGVRLFFINGATIYAPQTLSPHMIVRHLKSDNLVHAARRAGTDCISSVNWS